MCQILYPAISLQGTWTLHGLATGMRSYISLPLFLLSMASAFSVSSLGQPVPTIQNLWRLVTQEDTDGDRRITVRDRLTPFVVQDQQGSAVAIVSNAYPLSILLQEFKRAETSQRSVIRMDDIGLEENVVDRTHRLIKKLYWDALTRRIDQKHLDQVLSDPKIRSKWDFLYVPAGDEDAFRYFKRCEEQALARQRRPPLRVRRLPPPEQINGAMVRSMDGEHGLLSLKLEMDTAGNPVGGVPYVVPGGRFNELYYWDSYFIVLGLLEDGRFDLARGQADNLIYEIEAYGKIPNANRTYYLTRSQPPLLTSIIRTLYQAGAVNQSWLASALKAAVAEYRQIWMGRERLVNIGKHQLNRYADSGSGPCLEVEPGHYDEKILPWLEQAAGNARWNERLTPFRFLMEYQYCGKHAGLTVQGQTLDQFFKHDRVMRESGHDTTHRFDDRAADFLPCDLNAFLDKYEVDFAEVLDREFGGSLESLGPDLGSAEHWRRKAGSRKQAMNELMWDEGQGFYFDYDLLRGQRSAYVSATGLFPLWAGLLDISDPSERERPRRMAAFAHETLEQFGGLAASAQSSVDSARRKDTRQWDYPFGWAPHQMLAWQGLKNYGLTADAQRLAYRWLYTIARNAHDHNGVIPEKFNVVTASHEVFVEYGNVGARFDYIAPEGFGWVNASFQVGLRLLSLQQLRDLKHLRPPEKAPR